MSSAQAKDWHTPRRGGGLSELKRGAECHHKIVGKIGGEDQVGAGPRGGDCPHGRGCRVIPVPRPCVDEDELPNEGRWRWTSARAWW